MIPAIDHDAELRILIYSQDGYGLGHLRRNINITLQIKKRCPSASVLIMVDSPVAPFFKLPSKCDFIKLPTLLKVDYGIWRPHQLEVNTREWVRIRSKVIKNIAVGFQPHFFLVDHMPQGVLSELSYPLQAIKKYSPQTKMILGLRDILGAPEDICKIWRQENAFNLAEQYYDRVLIYGCEEVFDSLNEYRFPKAVAEKTQYCSYVCREDMLAESDNGKHDKLVPKSNKRLILVTGGGGHDAYLCMEKFLDAVSLLKRDLSFDVVISTGPFMEPEQIKQLQQKARGLPVKVSTFREEAIYYLKQADLVIAMAGYNTTCELMRFRKNAILIPRPGPSAEQSMRARILAERGLFSTIHPCRLTDWNLAELIMSKLHNSHTINEAAIPNLNGASKAASLIIKENSGLDLQPLNDVLQKKNGSISKPVMQVQSGH